MTGGWMGALRRRALVSTVVGLVALMAPAAAGAASQWWPSEPLPGGQLDGVTAMSIGPDGTGLIFMYDHTTGHDQLVVRPAGGPPKPIQALPAPLGAGGGAPVVGWFSDGSALIVDPSSNSVAYRSVGATGTVGPPQKLFPGQGEGGLAVATAPDGSALIALAGNLGAGVAYRSPGPNGTVDTQHAQFFGSDGNQERVVGVALDPDGGAVVVWYDAGTYYQSVRAPGAASFGNSTPIVTNPWRLAMATASNGYAILAWGGPAPVSSPSEVDAAIRAPGGGFGTPVKVADSEPFDLYPAIATSGDAVVAWDAGYNTYHAGSWGSASLVSDPCSSDFGPAFASGNSLLMASDSGTGGNTCDRSHHFVQLGTSGPGGITFGSPMSTPAPASNYGTSMAVGSSGTVLYVYESANSDRSFQSWRVLPYEDRSNLGSSGGGGSGGGGGGSGGGSGGGGGHVTPIVPRKLVVIAPLVATHPVISVTCPPQVADECAFRVSVFASFGAVPHPSLDTAAKRRGAKRAPLLGSASVVVRPGHKGVLRIKLTAAGRRAVAAGKAVRVRLVFQIRHDGKTASLLVSTTVRPAKHKRH